MKQNDIISIIQDNDISEYYSLKNLGIEGYAFPYQEALKIVQICKFLVIPILGGDVYSMNNSTIENLDDNWYYDRTPNESYYDYVQNSCNKSESYIRTFKNHSCDRPLFSFVLEDQLEQSNTGRIGGAALGWLVGSGSDPVPLGIADDYYGGEFGGWLSDTIFDFFAH